MFARLPRFSGLRRIYALKVEFNQTSIESLCSLPNLKHLLVEQCWVDHECRIDISSLTLKLSSFVFRDVKERGRPGDATHWPLMLDRHSLRELDAAPCRKLFDLGNDNEEHEGEASLSNYFPNVSKLSVGMCYKDIPANVKVLAKFPAVRTLSLESWGSRDVPEALAANILPVLAEYTGSYDTLRMVFPRATLVHLTVTICEAWELIAELKAIPLLNTVTTLDLTLYSVTNVDFNTIVGFFPQLVELRIAGGAESHPSVMRSPDIIDVEIDCSVDQQKHTWGPPRKSCGHSAQLGATCAVLA
jgi:hypothetical protein